MRRSGPLVVGGTALLGAVGLVALVAPLVVRHPNTTDYARQLLSPSWKHPLGTDANGRDELARTVAGARTTMGSAVLIFLLTTTAGVVLGGVSGYLRGPVDAAISRVIDVLLGLPSMIVALAVVGALGVGYWHLVLAISFSGWAYIGRITRSHVLGSRGRLDVAAARLAGVGRWRILRGHVLPPALAHVGVAAASTVGDTILALAGLSFLGLGAQPPTAELGQMLADSRGDLAACPWLAVGPAVILVLSVAGAVLLSDGLRDASDLRSVVGAGLIARRKPTRHRGLPLEVDDLSVEYPDGNRVLRGVSFTVGPQECVAVVGESGCGKTTLARALLRLLPPSTSVSGGVSIRGIDVLAATPAQIQDVRGLVAGYVSQDPYAACDPLQAVRRHVEEPWRARRLPVPAGAAASRVAALDVDPAALTRRPHTWSGGMLQRATIAAAHAHRPVLTIADEPTSALDTGLADGVLGCLRADSDAVLLISHDLRLVAAHSDRIVVLYAGVVVESGPTRSVIGHPRHPYTRALLDGLPIMGAPPADDPAGCVFAPRCPMATDRCTTDEPPLVDGVACWETVS